MALPHLFSAFRDERKLKVFLGAVPRRERLPLATPLIGDTGSGPLRSISEAFPFLHDEIHPEA